MDAEEERDRAQHRLDQFILFRTASIVAKAREDRPWTKEQEEQKRQAERTGKPPSVSEQEWRDADEAEKFWRSTRRDEALASQSPWHFEAVMGYVEHVFEEPPQPTEKPAVDMRQDYRERDQQATDDLIAALEAAVGVVAPVPTP